MSMGVKGLNFGSGEPDSPWKTFCKPLGNPVPLPGIMCLIWTWMTQFFAQEKDWVLKSLLPVNMAAMQCILGLIKY